jgi:hypothetical protein
MTGHPSMRTTAWLCAVLWLGACAHARDDHMSAEDHRDAAAKDEQQASADERRYDANAPNVSPYPGAMDPFGDPSSGGLQAYNPTGDYLQSANRHLRDAHQEFKAAAELEQFEDQACAGESREARRGCPFVTAAVRTVEETSSGVRLHLLPKTDGTQLLHAMRCHLAFARARGFKDVPECPLYTWGVSVELADGDSVIEVRGQNGKVASQVRRAARQLFAPTALPQPHA